jgi:Icc-related predicted phosphoesterase
MTRNVLELSVFEIVGSPFCVASDDGQKVHDRLAVALKEGHGVRLSFHNVTIVTSAFLNAAIGQLYGEFSEDQIRSLLNVSDIAADDLALLRRVVETAKQYFADPLTFEQAILEVQGGDGDD